jgi:Zn finger protein HypA/HybF involved in hydrogenase expression
MGINLTCPQCGKRMTIDLPTTEVFCKHCGYIRDTGLDAKAAEIRARGQRPNVPITTPGDLNARAISLFNTGHDYLFQGDKAAAIKAFKEALEIEPAFLDAHLWIAKTSDEAAAQRDHLSSILANAPGHPEAMRMMLVLNGRLTPEQAAAPEREVIVRRAEEPVKMKATSLRCPVCSGDLTIYDNRVECRFCGYQGEKLRQGESAGDLLIAALLERKTKAVKWIIGEHLLHCNQCGAERTIPATQLSARCPFCGSNHVIEQDALDSFEQPDGLIPFRISREEAGIQIKQQLRSVSERIKGIFGNNKVARATLNGYYLPFWVFDASVEITRTRIDNNPGQERRTYQRYEAYQQTRYDDALFDVEVCAVKSPDSELTARLGSYDTRQAVAYEPDLLAKYPAALYSIDFDEAALQARGNISTLMREKYGQRDTAGSDVTIDVFSNIRQMSFRLVLMPVWVGILVEEDGDVRAALVNGQTGKVVLGKAEKLPQ